jgi:predicted nucleic acid-binding protein
MPDQSVLVINTGPLIALVAAVGDLTVLQQLYRRVVVPREVCLEILAAGDDGFAAPQFSAASWLARLESPRQISQHLINSLDRGEASVIQAALDLGIDTVCIDEAVGRRMARLNGLKLTGSLGVLIRAKRELGDISITDAIASMRGGGIWISDHLASLAVREAGE